MSTTVAPTNIIVSSQLFSGDACQMGMAMRKRSSPVKWMLAVTFGAMELTPRCVWTQPFGALVVPEV